MTHLFWVRHGPTHQKVFTGWRDVPADLSDGATLARVSAFLPPSAGVISSDLSRAVATADAIASNRPRLTPDPALREFDFGAWDGLSFEQVAARDPDLSRTFWESPGDVAPPDGESWNMVATRVHAAIDAAVRVRPGHPLIAVAHFGAILTHLSTAGGIAPIQALSHHIDPLSITELRHGSDGWQIVRINHIA